MNDLKEYLQIMRKEIKAMENKLETLESQTEIDVKIDPNNVDRLNLFLNVGEKLEELKIAVESLEENV